MFGLDNIQLIIIAVVGALIWFSLRGSKGKTPSVLPDVPAVPFGPIPSFPLPAPINPVTPSLDALAVLQKVNELTKQINSYDIDGAILQLEAGLAILRSFKSQQNPIPVKLQARILD